MSFKKMQTPSGIRITQPLVFIGIWVLLVFLIYAWLCTLSVQKVHEFREDAIKRHRDRMDPVKAEAHLTQPQDVIRHAAASEVSVGIYLDHLSGFSIQDMYWEPNLFVWFRWKDPHLNPGETFRILGGQIESKEKLEEEIKDGFHYARYFVKVNINKSFNMSLFPVETHLMTIAIEDAVSTSDVIRYVPDRANTNLSSRLHFPAFSIQGHDLIEKPHSYKTNFGKDGLGQKGVVTHDEVVLGIGIERKGYGLYVKYFIGLFSATLIAMIAFFIKPTDVDPRFGLGVGGFFGAVANTLLSDGFIGQAETLCFIDIVNAIGLTTIFLSIVESTLSLYLYDILGQKVLSRKLDLFSAAIFGLVFISMVLVLPWIATQSV